MHRVVMVGCYEYDDTVQGFKLKGTRLNSFCNVGCVIPPTEPGVLDGLKRSVELLEGVLTSFIAHIIGCPLLSSCK